MRYHLIGVNALKMAQLFGSFDDYDAALRKAYDYELFGYLIVTEHNGELVEVCGDGRS